MKGLLSLISLDFIMHSNTRSVPCPSQLHQKFNHFNFCSSQKVRNAPSHPPILPAVPFIPHLEAALNVRKLNPILAVKFWGILIADLVGSPLWAGLHLQSDKKMLRNCKLIRKVVLLHGRPVWVMA